MPKTIAVGSVSRIKMDAVAKCYPKDTIIGFDVKSGVQGQPCGVSEILTGADNRSKGIREKYPHADVYIGIESGMIKRGSGMWVDIAAIAIKVKNRDTQYIWTDSIPIPLAGLKRSLDENGNVYRNWSAIGDPHLGLVKRSREQFIIDAIKGYFIK